MAEQQVAVLKEVGSRTMMLVRPLHSRRGRVLKLGEVAGSAMRRGCWADLWRGWHEFCDVHRGSYRWFAGCSENGEGGERGAERCQRVCGFVGSCWRVQQVGIG